MRCYEADKNVALQIKIWDINVITKTGSPVIAKLGCGEKKRLGRINVDKLNMPNVDIVADLENGLGFLPDNSVDEIHSRSVLAHIENFEFLMTELVRVLKKSGTAHMYMPHFSNPYYYSDYTHRRFFGLYSFYYFVSEPRQLKRKVQEFYEETLCYIFPCYGIDIVFGPDK